MNAAAARWRIRAGTSLKSSAVRHGFPTIWPVTVTSSGHGPGFCATAAPAVAYIAGVTGASRAQVQQIAGREGLAGLRPCALDARRNTSACKALALTRS
jgi:hypothetical protein